MGKYSNFLTKTLPALFLAMAAHVQAAQVTFTVPISFTVDPNLHLQTNEPNVSGISAVPFTFTVQGPKVTGTLFSINISVQHTSKATINYTGSDSDAAGYRVYQDIQSSLGFQGVHWPWDSSDDVVGAGPYNFTKTYIEDIGSSNQYYNGPEAPTVQLTGNESWTYTGTVTTTGWISTSLGESSNFSGSLDFENVVFSGSALFTVIDPLPVSEVPLPSALSMMIAPLLGLGYTRLKRRRSNR